MSSNTATVTLTVALVVAVAFVSAMVAAVQFGSQGVQLECVKAQPDNAAACLEKPRRR